tara:strand:- start:1595 stop:2017 length:423 start_codon:yes stop_codon:yes gene_type:complete
MIDPSFWDCPWLGKLSSDLRLLFIGLMCQADDEGKLIWEPALICSRIFPYHEEKTSQDIVAMASELMTVSARDPAIWEYQVDGRDYLWFTKWHEYQKPSHPTPSKLPDCPVDQLPESCQLPDSFYKAIGKKKEDFPHAQS